MTKYRNTGFEHILVKGKTLAEDLEISPEFQNKRLRKRKKHFNYEGNGEPIIDPLNAFKITFFNIVLDKTEQSLEDRFEQLKNHDNLFGFLGRFQTIKKEELKKHADLEIALIDSKIIQTDTSNNTGKPEVHLEGIFYLKK